MSGVYFMRSCSLSGNTGKVMHDQTIVFADCGIQATDKQETTTHGY